MRTLKERDDPHLNPSRRKIPYPICKRGLCKTLLKNSRINSLRSSISPSSVNPRNFNQQFSSHIKKHNPDSECFIDLSREKHIFTMRGRHVESK